MALCVEVRIRNQVSIPDLQQETGEYFDGRRRGEFSSVETSLFFLWIARSSSFSQSKKG